ncbi:peptidyl-prolyl cis-trans isomerase [Candidatus Poribacteria bacterium]|nr:peptidyl-prolyl cis-trans isomerase [Candidatus Poribacteria bacterium]
MKRALVITLMLLIVGSPLRGEIIERVVAAVNGEAITLTALRDEVESMGGSWGLPQARRKALENLIGRKLLLQEARRYGIFALETEVKAEMNKIISGFVSERAFNEELERRGMTRRDIEEEIRQRVMIYKLIRRKFESSIPPISDAEAAEYYRRNKEKFIDPERVRIEQTIIPKGQGRDLALKVADKLRRGEEIKDLKAILTRSSVYTPVDKLPSDIAEAVRKLKVGEVSDPIETPAGYLVLKLVDRKPPRQKSFDEVKSEIKLLIRKEKTQRAVTEWINRQKSSADIRILDPSLR